MKRAKLEELLKDVENSKTIIDEIMAENGKDIESTRKSFDDVVIELSKYKEGGEKYIEPTKFEAFKKFNPEDYGKEKTELETLRKYKSEVEGKETKSAQLKSLKELLTKGKYDEKVQDLLAKEAFDFEPKFSADNKIENSEELLSKIGEKYGQFKIVEQEGGFNPANPIQEKTPEEDSFEKGFNSEKR